MDTAEKTTALKLTIFYHMNWCLNALCSTYITPSLQLKAATSHCPLSAKSAETLRETYTSETAPLSYTCITCRQDLTHSYSLPGEYSPLSAESAETLRETYTSETAPLSYTCIPCRQDLTHFYSLPGEHSPFKVIQFSIYFRLGLCLLRLSPGHADGS